MGSGWNARVVRIKIAIKDIYEALLKKPLSFNEKEVIRQTDMVRKNGYDLMEDVDSYHISRNDDRFFLRKGSSDLSVFEQIYLKDEYKPLMAAATQNKIKVDTIVDIGSNIGLASRYFNGHYPNAFYICVEPDKDNFSVLKKNTASLKTVKLYQYAIWNNERELSIDNGFRDGQGWSLRVTEEQSNAIASVRSITVNKIIEECGLSGIDILKIDIEGAEFAVFESLSAVDFLRKVKVLAIEIHEDIGPRSVVVDKLLHYGFVLFEYSETIIGINKQLLIE
jgi:FkbM family methyltransferase